MILKNACLIIVTSIFLAAISKTVFAAEVNIIPDCLSDNSRLVVFTLLDLNYKVTKKKLSDNDTYLKMLQEKKTTRQIWKIDCSLKTSVCSAAMITVDNIEHGQKLNMLDMILPESAHLASYKKNLFTIVFGPFVTFTVDMKAGRVDYRESGPNIEVSGIGYCH